MSTKITMSYDNTYHFFAECYDRSNVYLQLPNDLVTQVPHYSETETETRVRIPVKIFREMFEAWKKGGWTDEEAAQLLADYEWPGTAPSWPGENEG